MRIQLGDGTSAEIDVVVKINVGDLRGCVDARVGASGHDQLGCRVEAQDAPEPQLQFAGDGAQARLVGPDMEGRAVIG